MKLSKEKMTEIISNKLINQCTKEERKQVFNFAFGSQFMNSKDKGEKKQYKI